MRIAIGPSNKAPATQAADAHLRIKRCDSRRIDEFKADAVVGVSGEFEDVFDSRRFAEQQLARILGFETPGDD